ncbi:MAG: phosphate ABC transporter permease PstA [Actinomycetota bacterium]|nr:phosphate ABC transporter permease PstA [Actinomycetota bacterium]
MNTDLLDAEPTSAAADVSLAANVAPLRRARDVLFRLFLYSTIAVALGILMTVLIRTWLDGSDKLSLDMVLHKQPSERPARAGIESGVYGTLWVTGFCALLTLPLGIATAVYLEEFAHKTRWYNRLIEVNIQNLAAVPSIVYGILGLAFIARGPLGWGPTVATAGLILALVVLPTVIIASREAIRAVPSSLSAGSLALGATRWQTVRKQVLPAAAPGIATGSILAISRAIGETAPLLLIGGLTFISKNPSSLDDRYTTVPLLIYSYAVSSKAELREVAAAAIIVLMIVLLLLNGTAILIRNRYQRRW